MSTLCGIYLSVVTSLPREICNMITNYYNCTKPLYYLYYWSGTYTPHMICDDISIAIKNCLKSDCCYFREVDINVELKNCKTYYTILDNTLVQFTVKENNYNNYSYPSYFTLEEFKTKNVLISKDFREKDHTNYYKKRLNYKIYPNHNFDSSVYPIKKWIEEMEMMNENDDEINSKDKLD